MTETFKTKQSKIYYKEGMHTMAIKNVKNGTHWQDTLNLYVLPLPLFAYTIIRMIFLS